MKSVILASAASASGLDNERAKVTEPDRCEALGVVRGDQEKIAAGFVSDKIASQSTQPAAAKQHGLFSAKQHYLGGVCSKGSLVYRAFSISITSATLPSGLRKGKGFPVYLSEIGSMWLKSPSGRRSTTRPRSWAS